MRIHLDVLGGMAGDMFIAAVLDAFPALEPAMLASIAAVAPAGVVCGGVVHNDGVFSGHRFRVAPPPEAAERHDRRHDHDDQGHDHGADEDHHHHDAHDHHHDHGHHEPASSEAHAGAHGHEPWLSIRARLEAAALDPPVRTHAVAIFAGLAQAEARVHGVTPDEVLFHEVGAWDSIADVVGAAHLIATLGASEWSVSTLPLGSGRIRTAHGLMPVPAPATVLLLEGFDFIDDGAPGERVTPTGAAILRHLFPSGPRAATGGKMSRAGVGFGTRELAGVSNCLRVLVFEEPGADAASSHRELLVIEFEVDDQSAEDLAVALDRLRVHADVFDVVQAPVFGKKGRMMTHVRILARSAALDAVTAAVFRETTTIGLRHHRVGGEALSRQAVEAEVAGRRVRVKTVDRPGGRTAKAESDDALTLETHAARAELRRAAEHAALHETKPA